MVWQLEQVTSLVACWLPCQFILRPAWWQFRHIWFCTAGGEANLPLNNTPGAAVRLARCSGLGPWQDSQPCCAIGVRGSPCTPCTELSTGDCCWSLWHVRQVFGPSGA